jgi:hypothetical protein
MCVQAALPLETLWCSLLCSHRLKRWIAIAICPAAPPPPGKITGGTEDHGYTRSGASGSPNTV